MRVRQRLESTSRFWIAWGAIGMVLLVGLVLLPLATAADVPRFNRWVVEVWLIAGVVGLVVLRLRPFQVWTGLQRLVFSAIAVGMLVAQLSPVPLPLYPFSEWAMYTEPVEEVTYPAFVMLSDGEEVGHLPIADLVPNVLGREIMDRFGELARRAEDGDAGATRAIETLLRRLIEAHGAPQVDAVEARSCTTSGHGSGVVTNCRTVLVVAR